MNNRSCERSGFARVSVSNQQALEAIGCVRGVFVEPRTSLRLEIPEGNRGMLRAVVAPLPGVLIVADVDTSEST